jgi:hypothetical protein
LRYEATLDRVGLALGLGSVLGGGIALGLTLLGGDRDPLHLVMLFLLGTLFVGIGITAVAGPLWLVMHVAGLRRWYHAAMVGAFTALAIFIGAQTYQFGLLEMPALDGRTWMFRWISAIGTSLLLAIVAAVIGLIMWRIAYRRQREN